VGLRIALVIFLLACSAPQAPAHVAIAPVDAGEPPRTDASLSQTSSPRSIADDPTRTVDERCADAFATFRTRIHAGDSAATVRAVLGSPTWIGSDKPINAVGGELPIDFNFTDQDVVVMCLPKPDPRMDNLPWSPWVIYMRLEGRTSQTFGAFLTTGGTAKLAEYALCHVDSTGQGMKIERFR